VSLTIRAIFAALTKGQQQASNSHWKDSEGYQMPTDVIVVGAGPVGLAMASELAWYGVAVRVVDKNPARSDKSKALVLWAPTLELMNRMESTELQALT
jgi:heterodisulfide reductase subunit A-like polyferredoxin